MSTRPIPDQTGFATAIEAVEYERWFRAKVQEALDDPSPRIPHEQVMAQMRALLQSRAQASN